MTSRTPAEGEWLSATSRLDDDGENESGSDMEEAPRHPVPKMQGAFEESMMETMQEVPEDDFDIRYSTADSISRRKILLEQDHYERVVAGKWKQKPGEKFHPLWKLVAQISFGMHLLSQGLAKSDEEVIKLLQSHVDEIDGFLERTTADFDLAHEDIIERIRCLRLPLEHGEVFDTMLEDRSFRIAIVEGNEKIEHIVNRTNVAMKDALKDVQKGLDGTRELTRYLTQLQRTWVDQTEEHQAVYSAMLGNTEGWTRAYMTLQSKGSKLGYGLSELAGIISRIQTRAGIASRKNIPPPRTVEGNYFTESKASPAAIQRATQQPQRSREPTKLSFPMPPASRPAPQHQPTENGIGNMKQGKPPSPQANHDQRHRSLLQKLKKRPPSSINKSPVSPQSCSAITLLDGTSSLPSPTSTVNGGRSRPLSTTKRLSSSPQNQVTIHYDPEEESDQLSPLPFEKSMSEYMLYHMNEPSSPRSLSSFKNSKGERHKNSLGSNPNHRPPSPQKDVPPLTLDTRPVATAKEAPPAAIRDPDSTSSQRSSIDFLKSPSVRSSIHIDYFEDATKNSEPASPKSTKSRTKEVRFANAAAGKPIKAMLVDLPLRHYRSQDAIDRTSKSSDIVKRTSSLKMSKAVLSSPKTDPVPKVPNSVPTTACSTHTEATCRGIPLSADYVTCRKSPSPASSAPLHALSAQSHALSAPSHALSAPSHEQATDSEVFEAESSEDSTVQTPKPESKPEGLVQKSVPYFPPMVLPVLPTTTSSPSSEEGATPPPILTSKPSLAPLLSPVLTKTPASDTSSNRTSASTASSISETSSTLASFPKPPSSSSSTPRTPQPPPPPSPSGTRQNSSTQAECINPLLKVPVSPPAQHGSRTCPSSTSSPKPSSPKPSSPPKSPPPKTSPAKTPSPDFTLATPAAISSFDAFPTDFSSFDSDGTCLTSATLFPTRQMPSPLIQLAAKRSADIPSPSRPMSYVNSAASPAPPAPNGATLPAGRLVVLEGTRGGGATFGTPGTARLQEEDRRMKTAHAQPESERTTAASSRRGSVGRDSVRKGGGGGGAWIKGLGSRMGTLVGGRRGKGEEKSLGREKGLGMAVGNESRSQGFMGMGKDGTWIRGGKAVRG